MTEERDPLEPEPDEHTYRTVPHPAIQQGTDPLIGRWWTPLAHAIQALEV